MLMLAHLICWGSGRKPRLTKNVVALSCWVIVVCVCWRGVCSMIKRTKSWAVTPFFSCVLSPRESNCGNFVSSRFLVCDSFAQLVFHCVRNNVATNGCFLLEVTLCVIICVARDGPRSCLFVISGCAFPSLEDYGSKSLLQSFGDVSFFPRAKGCGVSCSTTSPFWRLLHEKGISNYTSDTSLMECGHPMNFLLAWSHSVFRPSNSLLYGWRW